MSFLEHEPRYVARYIIAGRSGLGCHVGTILWSARDETQPLMDGWLPADGALKRIADWPELYALMGQNWRVAVDVPPSWFERVILRRKVRVVHECVPAGMFRMPSL